MYKHVLDYHSELVLKFFKIMEADDSEASRLSRFFLYKHRERLPVRKAQIKGVLDKGNDEKNKEINAVERSKKY